MGQHVCDTESENGLAPKRVQTQQGDASNSVRSRPPRGTRICIPLVCIPLICMRARSGGVRLIRVVLFGTSCDFRPEMFCSMLQWSD